MVYELTWCSLPGSVTLLLSLEVLQQQRGGFFLISRITDVLCN